ncbi:MAG: dTMP kinase [SAR202 cluster bacterium Casp-Chloro-G4]|nr:dTMP kinase [Chloroflexota bacterium]MDA1227900.1 dTMP kinase [Chloroflexota bacterium]PKB61424.1 MAG: dTMP kinase [SAR202 cluster bacterium Casp-Chloro-G4]
MGLFIVFEGVEGSGKSTQSRELYRRLQKAELEAVLIREPGGTPTAEYVRDWLIGGHDISPLTELLLFSATRASLVESVIRPALSKGEIVVCDRYIYSTLAYQGYGRGMDMGAIDNLNGIATGGLEPELVVLLDLPPDIGFQRKRGGDPNDRFEREDLAFHQRVHEGYNALAANDPKRWLVLDASLPMESLASAIWDRVLEIQAER